MNDETTAERLPQPAATNEALSFSGSAGEYFRIWIVNLCLTIVTLGIYSPWAKVRRNKYLYGHSHLAGASFDYHANPVAILKGRLIAVGMLALYLVSSALVPVFSLAIALLIALAVPWLLVRSRMFAMRNTSYRNVRFRFSPVYGQAYKVIVGYLLLTIVTLGIAYPWARFHRSRLIVDNTGYGTLDMHLDEHLGGGDFLAIYMGAGILALGVGLVTAIGLGLGGSFFGGAGSPEGVPFIGTFLSVVFPILFYLALYFGTEAAIQRLILRSTWIASNQLQCSWGLPGLSLIYLSNLFAIALSFGLLIPWATIRLQRYKLAGLALTLGRDELEAVVAAQAEEVSALGDEIGEAFDYDFGL
jgi:uncharacterized membrane protein YjgN (DUF898 family)